MPPPPPPGSGGYTSGTLAGERGVGRVSIPTRGHTLWYYLYIRIFLWSAPFLKVETIVECRHCLNSNLWSINQPEIESDAVDRSGEGEAAECQEDEDKVGKQRGEVYHVTARLHALHNRGLTRLNQEDQDKVGNSEVKYIT